MSMNNASVVICAYTERRWHDLNEALDAVGSQSLPPHETIVVVDHNPSLAERVAAARTDVRVLESLARPGLAAARNVGVAEAQGSVVVFLDDDAVPDPTWLAALMESYTHPDVLGVGGAVESHWLGARPRWFPHEFEWVVGCSYRGLPTTRAQVRNPIGANMSLRRDVLEAVGGFREDMGRVGTVPLGCEETELCIRARQRWRDGFFVYEPAARVRHKVPPTRTTWKYFQSRCYAEGLSKARVSGYVGAADGLAAERSHATRALPLGFARACSSGEPARAASIVAGLATVVAGYVRGRIGGMADHAWAVSEPAAHGPTSMSER
jgi:glucosyl-dolichyl phosphate glucuronosyltransferase